VLPSRSRCSFTLPKMLQPDEQVFAEGLAKGLKPQEAYRLAKGMAEMSKAALYKGASRWSKNVHIQEEVERIRQAAQMLAGGAVATVAEIKEFLTLVIRTAIGTVDESSILCQELTRKVIKGDSKGGTSDGQADLFGQEAMAEVVAQSPAVLEKVKMPDKLKAADMLLNLAGAYPANAKDVAQGDLAVSEQALVEQELDALLNRIS